LGKTVELYSSAVILPESRNSCQMVLNLRWDSFGEQRKDGYYVRIPSRRLRPSGIGGSYQPCMFSLQAPGTMVPWYDGEVLPRYWPLASVQKFTYTHLSGPATS
jgi:hypothetical protein